MKVVDLMKTDVRSVTADLPVSEVIVALADARVSGLPVVDARNRLIGVVSSTDVIGAQAETIEWRGASGAAGGNPGAGYHDAPTVDDRADRRRRRGSSSHVVCGSTPAVRGGQRNAGRRDLADGHHPCGRQREARLNQGPAWPAHCDRRLTMPCGRTSAMHVPAERSLSIADSRPARTISIRRRGEPSPLRFPETRALRVASS